MYLSKTGLTAFQVWILSFLTILLFGCAHKPSTEFVNLSSTLDTPQSISVYQIQNFSYGLRSEGYGCGRGVSIAKSTSNCEPDYIFDSKSGNCGAFTTFAVHFLKQAGYEAYSLKVFEKWPPGIAPGVKNRDYHYIALYKDYDMWYLIDNGRRKPRGISGPYESIEKLPFKVLNIEGYKIK